MNEILLAKLNRAQRIAFVVGAAALIACVIGAFSNPHQFFISYLYSYLFWLGLSLGCLCLAMIHNLTGGRWGDVTRRFLEAGYMTLPMMAVLFLPILGAVRILYQWAQSSEVPLVKVLTHRQHYMNVPAFTGRAIFFFAIGIIMALLLRRWSLQQNETTDVTPTRRARALSGPGVVIYPLMVTFGWIDWVMSLEPDWYSTMFAIIICAGHILSTIAFAIIMLAWFREDQPFQPLLASGQFHQLGNLLLTFVMFWTYVSLGQLIVIWSGNLPHEIIWYQHRIQDGWRYVVGFLALFNFFLPFFLLLFRASKKQAQSLRTLAWIVFMSQIVENYWLVEPAFYPEGFHLNWMDVLMPIGFGGAWMATFAFFLKRAPLLTRNDPRISYSFAHAD